MISRETRSTILFSTDLGKDTLDLSPLTEQPVAIPGLDIAHHAVLIDLDRFCSNGHFMSDWRRSEMIDAEMRTDSLLLFLQVGSQDFSGGQFHVMGHRPGRIDSVDDDAVEGGAHVFRDGDCHFHQLASLEGIFTGLAV